jgi:hypothetical protein
MKNKNLIIGIGLAVVVYYFYNKNQKKKLQATPYTDAELDKIVTDYVNKSIAYIQKREPNVKHKTFKEVFDGIMQLINNAKINNKNVSKEDIDKLLFILELQYRNESGDVSLGQTTKEQWDFMINLTHRPTTLAPVQSSQGFFPQTPVGQSQIAPINVGSEERNMGDGLYIKYGKCDSVTYKCQIISVRQLAQGEGGGYVRTFTEKGMYFKEKGNVNVAPIITQITEKEWSDLMQYVLKKTGF